MSMWVNSKREACKIKDHRSQNSCFLGEEEEGPGHSVWEVLGEKDFWGSWHPCFLPGVVVTTVFTVFFNLYNVLHTLLGV